MAAIQKEREREIDEARLREKELLRKITDLQSEIQSLNKQI